MGLRVALGFGALACSDPREVELVQEMAALQESRVPKSSLERMKVEADAAEARVAELAPQLDAVRGEIEARKGASAALEAGMQGEIARNQALNSDIQAAQDSLRQAVEKQASLEQEVARERARAPDLRRPGGSPLPRAPPRRPGLGAPAPDPDRRGVPSRGRHGVAARPRAR